jgi:hypothetical protein
MRSAKFRALRSPKISLIFKDYKAVPATPRDMEQEMSHAAEATLPGLEGGIT